MQKRFSRTHEYQHKFGGSKFAGPKGNTFGGSKGSAVGGGYTVLAHLGEKEVIGAWDSENAPDVRAVAG